MHGEQWGRQRQFKGRASVRLSNGCVGLRVMQRLNVYRGEMAWPLVAHYRRLVVFGVGHKLSPEQSEPYRCPAFDLQAAVLLNPYLKGFV